MLLIAHLVILTNFLPTVLLAKRCLLPTYFKSSKIRIQLKAITVNFKPIIINSVLHLCTYRQH